MIRFLVRLAGYVLIAAGFVSLVIDGARSIANSAVMVTPLGETLALLLRERYLQIQPAVERNLHPLLWDPVLLWADDGADRAGGAGAGLPPAAGRRPARGSDRHRHATVKPPGPAAACAKPEIVPILASSRSDQQSRHDRPSRPHRTIRAGRSVKECPMFFLRKKSALPQPSEALPGRDRAIPTAERHFLSKRPLQGPYPEGLQTAMFGMGCFWGVERKFWQLGDGIWITAVGLRRRLHPEPDL